MSCTNVFLVALIVWAAPFVGHGQDRTPDLDLTAIGRLPQSEADGPVVNGVVVGTPGRVGGGFVSHEVAKPLPIALRLLNIEPESCHWADAMSYDVEVKNLGTTNLVLPWSTDPRDMGEPTGARNIFPTLSIVLVVTDETGDHFSGAEALYGSSYNAQTIRSVPPGGTVVIRAGAICQLVNARNASLVASKGNMSFQVAAQVRLAQNRGAIGATLTTSPRTVTVTRPKVP